MQKLDKLAYVVCLLKGSRKNNFDELFNMSYKERKEIFEIIHKDERVILFLNNANKYISSYSRSTQYFYLKKKILFFKFFINPFSNYYMNLTDSNFFNDLLIILNLILKKVPSNNPQP